jgi:hypothetical protein
MFKFIKNYQKKKELAAVLKWCQEFEKSNSNQREFKTFKIWATAKFINKNSK